MNVKNKHKQKIMTGLILIACLAKIKNDLRSVSK